MSVKLRGRFKPKNRVELEQVLKGRGLDGKLFKDDESRDKAKWILKQEKLGETRKTVHYDKP